MNMKTSSIQLTVLVLVITVGCLSVLNAAASRPVWMGEETFGNKPLNAANYKNWPKLMPVANNTNRVYHTWVNGDERFYYEATAEELNQLLEDFSKLDSKTKEVLLVPQREPVRSFDRSKQFSYNCSMYSTNMANMMRVLFCGNYPL